LAELRAVELWYIQIDRERSIAKARAMDGLRAFAKLTELVDGRHSRARRPASRLRPGRHPESAADSIPLR
jgi:hypothetical protein